MEAFHRDQRQLLSAIAVYLRCQTVTFSPPKTSLVNRGHKKPDFRGSRAPLLGLRAAYSIAAYNIVRMVASLPPFPT